MKRHRVLIIDDHAVLRMGLSSLINAEAGLTVAGEAGSGEQGVELAKTLSPDIIILDLMMPGTDVMETLKQLFEQDPDSRVLILTSYGTSDALGHALSSGAMGAVLKSAPFPEILQAIHNVARGERYVSPEIERLLASNPPVPALSPRQIEILDGISRGLSNADLAKLLGIGPDVVKLHTTALFNKLGAANRAEAVAIALRKHLLKT